MKDNKQIKREGCTIDDDGLELSVDTKLKGKMHIDGNTTIQGATDIQNTLTVKNNTIKEGRIGIGKTNPDLALDIEVCGKNHDGIRINKKDAKAYAFKVAHDDGGGYFHMHDKHGDWQISMMANEKKIKIGSVELNEDELKLFKIMNKPIWNIYTYGQYQKTYLAMHNNNLCTTPESYPNTNTYKHPYYGRTPELPINIVFEKEGEYYRIKHDATENYLTFSGSKVKLEKKKEDKTQLIRFIVNSNGSFSIQSTDSKQYMYYGSPKYIGMNPKIITEWHISPGKIDLHTFLREL